MRLRVVHVVLDLHEGGLERIVTDLVHHAAEAGEPSHVVCLTRAGRLAEELAPDQFTVLSGQTRLSMLAPVALARALKALKPDVLHLHSGVWYKGAYASRLAGLGPVVFTDHGRPQPDHLSQRVLDGLGARMTDRVVAVSTPLADYLADRLLVPRKRLSVITNGIRLPPPAPPEDRERLRLELSIPAGAQIVGTVGRLDPVKAYDNLIAAFARLLSADPAGCPRVLLIVGDGPERAPLEQLAREHELGDAVRFLGWRKDVPRLLSLMDVFVLSSDSEGTSISLLEAMASGVPVVATAVGGTPDVIHSERVGSLVPPGNVAALASAIGDLLSDPGRRSALGEQGRARVEAEYSFGAMAREYQVLYQQALFQRQRRIRTG